MRVGALKKKREDALAGSREAVGQGAKIFEGPPCDAIFPRGEVALGKDELRRALAGSLPAPIAAVGPRLLAAPRPRRPSPRSSQLTKVSKR